MEIEWRCKRCRTLLGIQAGQRIRVSYRKAQFVIEGRDCSVMAVCHTCSTLNEVRTAHRPHNTENTEPLMAGGRR